MSHFSVFVVADDADHLERVMAPYQENNMGDCPKEFMEFTEVEEETKQEWESDTLEEAYLNTITGEYAWRFDRRFSQTPGVYSSDTKYIYPFPWKRVDVTYRDFYGNSYDRYMSEYHCYKLDEEIGKYGYWSNPNSKWDWWVVGGRWQGALRLKPDIAVLRNGLNSNRLEELYGDDRPYDGEASWGRHQDNNEFTCDSCIMEHLDIIWHKTEQERARMEEWEKWHDPNRPPVPDTSPEGRAADDYKEVSANFHEWLRIRGLDSYRIYDNIDALNESKTRDEYVERTLRAICFAHIDENGKWVANSDIGMFAVTWNEDENYSRHFWQWIETLNPKQRVYVVDCHV